MSKYADKQTARVRKATIACKLPGLVDAALKEMGAKRTRYVRNGHKMIRLGSRSVGIMKPLKYKNTVLGYYGYALDTIWWREAE
jgi:hypothetical protein